MGGKEEVEYLSGKFWCMVCRRPQRLIWRRQKRLASMQLCTESKWYESGIMSVMSGLSDGGMATSTADELMSSCMVLTGTSDQRCVTRAMAAASVRASSG